MVLGQQLLPGGQQPFGQGGVVLNGLDVHLPQHPVVVGELTFCAVGLLPGAKAAGYSVLDVC